MCDRETESLWQFTGEGLVGAHAGRRLAMVGARIVPWRDFVAAHPDARVLSTETGERRAYGRNPYAGYSTLARPFLYDGRVDPRLPAMARVVGVVVGTDSGDVAVAWPLEEVRRRGRIDDEVGGAPIVVRYHDGTIDALDAGRLEASRRLGSASVERPDGTPVPHLDAFWFAWAAFHPGTEVRGR